MVKVFPAFVCPFRVSDTTAGAVAVLCREADPQPQYIELILPGPVSRKQASRQSRPGSGTYAEAPVQFHRHSSRVLVALFVSRYASLPKSVPLSLHLARDSSVSTVILKYRGMLSLEVHRPQARPQSTCRTGMRNQDLM